MLVVGTDQYECCNALSNVVGQCDWNDVILVNAPHEVCAPRAAARTSGVGTELMHCF